MSESVPKTCLTVMGSKLMWTAGFTVQGSASRAWPAVELNGSGHQGWPRGHGHFTREAVSVGFQCHAGVTTLCPPHPASPHHQYPLCPSTCLTPFPSPLSSSCHLMAQCAPRPFVLCFTAVNVTWVTLSLLSTDGPLFATLLKRPPLTFHVFSFLLRAREPLSSLFTQPYDNTHIFSSNARTSFPASYFCFLLFYSLQSFSVVCIKVNTLDS